MPDQEKDLHTPNPQGGDDEGGEERKLFAGKYKDPEDAYKGLEKGFHETRQEISQIRELLESYRPQGDDYQRGGYAPAPQDNPQEGVETLTRFYQNPDKVLSSVEERAAARAAKQFQEQQEANTRMQRRVADWSARNQDVAPHQDMLTYWVNQTDGRLSPETRLDQAAAKVRERLAQLKAGDRSPSPRPGDYVDGPDGGQPPRKPAPQKQRTLEGEDALKSYAAGRNANKLQFPGKK